MIFERMCNLFVAAVILSFIVLSQMTCASIHVYGFEVKENVVEYEKNLTLCSVRNRMIKEVSNPDALSRKTLVAETFEALIFREGTMFEVRYSPQKNENSFSLQDEDIVFFKLRQTLCTIYNQESFCQIALSTSILYMNRLRISILIRFLLI